MATVGGVSLVHLVEPVATTGGGGGGGSVTVTNFPAEYPLPASQVAAIAPLAVQPVSGTVSAAQSGTWTVAASQSGAWSVGRTWNLSFANDKADVSGSAVSVSNFPAVQAVSQSGTWNINNITGTVSLPTGAATAANQLPDNHQVQVSNFPATQVISGTVAATQSGVWSVGRTWNLTFANDKADVSGSSVAVSNFPATQAVSGTVTANQGGTWSVGRTWALSGATDSVNIGNFPATQAVSGSVSVNNFPATQAVSGTVTANLGALNGAALDSSVQAINGKLPDESGAWGYNAGTAGTLTVAANKRILAISATAPALTAASMTINGGQTITIPAGTSITISPKANLTAPTLVFTSTASYFVEFIE